jgi:two-component system CheB/CheR fusion protein
VLTAKFESMPRSAIAAGVADFVLPPAEIARQLAAIARDSRVSGELREAMEPTGDPALTKILRLVRNSTGVDFTYYKHSTLARRIKRRMTLRGFERLEDYSRDLEQNREEAKALCENCFITVTAFFREPGVFEELKKKVFPALVENRPPADPIRIWVPGCATGEEASAGDPKPEPRSHAGEQGILRDVPGRSRGDGGPADLRPRQWAMEHTETARTAGEHSPRALYIPGL